MDLDKLIPDLAEELPKIKIRGAEVPVKFDWTTVKYITKESGKSLTTFADDLDKLNVSADGAQANTEVMDLLGVIIYAAVKSAGNTGEALANPDTLLSKFKDFGEIMDAFQVVLDLFSTGYFQSADTDKLKADSTVKN